MIHRTRLDNEKFICVGTMVWTDDAQDYYVAGITNIDGKEYRLVPVTVKEGEERTTMYVDGSNVVVVITSNQYELSENQLEYDF